MKKIKVLAFALLIGASSIAKEGNHKVDQKVSSIEWVGKKVTGEHSGTIKISEGTINVEGDKIASGDITIDMNSIAVTDIKDAETNQKLKGHLMSDDFFGVNNFPTANLKINKTEKIEGNKYKVHADLTIKGKTEKVEFPAVIMMEDNKVVAIGDLTIDRTKFGIKYGSGQFFEDLGDRMIYDDFTISFKVGAK